MKIKNKISLGVDIGGSHISAAAVDLSTYKILPGTYYQACVDNKEEKNVILKSWGKTIAKSMEASNMTAISGIGIAMPGPFDYPNGRAMFIGNDKYDSLYNVDIRKELSRILDYKPENIHFFNDAASFTVGASLQNNVYDKKVIGITLGTGFGASFLKDNFPAIEGQGIPDNGCLWDKPYKKGIADDYFSTRWFLAKSTALNGKSFKGVKELIESDPNNTSEIFKEFSANLSEFLSPYITGFNADAILFGGSISKSHHLFLENLSSTFHKDKNIFIEIVENTEVCNILGATRLKAMDYWRQQNTPTAFF